MRPALLLATLALSVSAATAAQATVAVHGMNQDALGAAILSVTTDPAGAKKLVMSNIGSSGNDGVSIELKRTNGLWLVYGTPPPAGPGLPSKPIVHRDLAARLYGQAPSAPLHHMSEDVGLSGTGVDLSFSIPGSPDAVIELYNGIDMVYSARKGYQYYQAQSSLHLEGPSVAVDEPGVAVAFRFGRPAINTALNTSCSFEMLRPSACEVTIDGVAYSADRIKVQFPSLPSSPEMRCIEGIVRASCLADGSPGSGDMAISCKGAPATPVKKKAHSQGLTVSAVSGVTLADGGGAGDLQRVRLVADGGSTPEPARVSLWGLPPGTPVLARTAEDLSVRILQGSSSQLPGQTVTFKVLPVSGVAGIAGGVVAGIVVAAVVVTTTGVGPNEVSCILQPDPYAQSQRVEVYKHVPGQPEPQLVVTSNGGNGIEVRAPKSGHHRVHVESGVITMGFGFAPGSTVSVGGVPYDADSVVFVTTRPTENIIGFASEDLELSPSTELTLLSTEGAEYGMFREDGKVVVCHGSARFVNMGGGPTTIHNIGSSGNDGVSYMTDGVPSVRMPFQGGLTLDAGAGLQIDADPCDDGECVPITSLVMRRSQAGQPETVSLALTSQLHNNPAFQSNSHQGHMVRMALDLDSDGDGLAELHALPGSRVSFSSIAYRQLSPYRESFQLVFQSPVRIIVNGVPFTINSLEIGYNISGQPLGGAAPKPKAVTVLNLPPGMPYFRTISGNSFEGVTASGSGSDGAIANNNIDGFPVLPTWAEITGPGKFIDPDGDGPAAMELLKVRARDSFGNPSQADFTVRSLPENDTSDEKVDGHIVKGDLDLIPIGSDGAVASIVEAVEVAGSVGLKNASVDVTASPGGSAVPHRLVFSHLDIADAVVCKAYLNGVLQSSFPYTGEVQCSRLPIRIAMYRAAGDGTLQTECRFRSPVTLSSGAIVVVCDELRLVPVAGYPISKVRGAALTLHGLPPGEAVTGFQIARIVPASVILAAPGDGLGTVSALFALSPAYPNPMRAASTVRFSLPAKQHVRAVVMDVAGRQVAALADQDYEAGEHTLRWNGMGEGGAPVPAGLYFVRVERGGEAKIARVTRLK